MKDGTLQLLGPPQSICRRNDVRVRAKGCVTTQEIAQLTADVASLSFAPGSKPLAHNHNPNSQNTYSERNKEAFTDTLMYDYASNLGFLATLKLSARVSAQVGSLTASILSACRLGVIV